MEGGDVCYFLEVQGHEFESSVLWNSGYFPGHFYPNLIAFFLRCTHLKYLENLNETTYMKKKEKLVAANIGIVFQLTQLIVSGADYHERNAMDINIS